MSYKEDRVYADQYLSEVRRILQNAAKMPLEIKVADNEKDTQEATDITVNVKTNNEREYSVAVRLRRANVKFRDLTIRAWRSSGAKTELQKIKDGYCDYYLYGWIQELTIPEWMLVDVNKIRKTSLLDKSPIPNTDNTTKFIAIPYQELIDHDCLLAGIIAGNKYPQEGTFKPGKSASEHISRPDVLDLTHSNREDYIEVTPGHFVNKASIDVYNKIMRKPNEHRHRANQDPACRDIAREQTQTN